MRTVPATDDRLPLEERLVAAFEGAEFWRDPGFEARMKRLSMRTGITYEDERGRPIFMNYGLLPVVIPASCLRYMAARCADVQTAVRCVVPAWLEGPRLRDLLPLWPEEEEFLRDVWTPGGRLLSRLDVSCAAGNPHAAQFYEWNGNCVGGMHYSPAGERMIERHMLPRVADGRLPLHAQPDLRDLILRLLRGQAQGGAIVLLEDRTMRGGITEYPSMARHFRAPLADPRELELRRGAVTLRGRPVGAIYRNVEVRDLVEIERKEGRLEPVRAAFRENRVVSAALGEFDHKSLWEVIADPPWRRLFPAALRARLARHLPWTRLVSERRTGLPGGRAGELVPFVRRHQRDLVLKPNRSCGGRGVTIGRIVSRAAWEAAIEHALRDTKEGWVVQSWVPAFRKRLPLLHSTRGVVLEPVFVNYGVVWTPAGSGLIGRVCREPIVNVSRGGAQMAMFLARG